MEQQLHEFPVLLEDKNEILTLFLNEEDMAKASQDSTFLLNLIAKEQNKNNNNEPIKSIDLTHDENAVDQNNAAEMKETNAAYNITALQCSSKMSGLKRTYKNITDLNKKSGNNRNTWAFFSVMDSLFGDKASIKPPAIATSEGPSDPNEKESLLSTVSSLESKGKILYLYING
ncbi:hypothetical protein ALC62_07167 [Cyphomyrmex costatus]|uniref:Myb/SANT-like DNA-binding domain-containing protein n=1 Tax=Cyphomyrmex costatus TaxID=456900 RepID=A0A151II12_9HYME|nr:hypothetical protein ALC62_07167 [Cyphomyrmex costatus]